MLQTTDVYYTHVRNSIVQLFGLFFVRKKYDFSLDFYVLFFLVLHTFFTFFLFFYSICL